MLPDVFENFKNKCIEIYELDPAHFLSPPRLAWQACFKKSEVELELLTNIDILFMECVMQYIVMLKQIINIWKIMIKK